MLALILCLAVVVAMTIMCYKEEEKDGKKYNGKNT